MKKLIFFNIKYIIINKLKMTEIPCEFICPVTFEIMEDPVICCDGYTYEKSVILNLPDSLSPLTRQQIDKNNLIPNRNLKDAIERYKKISNMSKLDIFDNKSFEDYDNVLFDKNGLQIINSYNSRIMMVNQYWDIPNEAKKRNNPHYPLSIQNNGCFTITEQKTQIHFFKNIIIQQDYEPPGCDIYVRPPFTIFKHNISSDCLFAIKYLRNGVNSIMDEHPEYFKKKCSCEYGEIEKTKLQLKSLMDEYISKKNYYASLDEKFKDFEQDKKQLEEERQKIKEEKEKMVFIKEKLFEMKKEVELEKQKIEQQKNKTIDFDKCFEDIISFNFISEIHKK